MEKMGYSRRHPKQERDESWGMIILRFFESAFRHPLNRFLHPDTPYFTRKAVKFLEVKLQERQDIKMFEFGSGVSTFWWADRVQSYIGVEHHKGWYDNISSQINEKGLENAELRYVPIGNGILTQNHDSMYQELIGRTLPVTVYIPYAESIDEYPDKSFDLICIDGRDRTRTALHAYSKIKDDGIIVLDDSSRPDYKDIFHLFSDWKANRFDGGIQQTTVFTKE